MIQSKGSNFANAARIYTFANNRRGARTAQVVLDAPEKEPARDG
ncbi:MULTISPECIES: hypothetical protein [Paenibacillus]|nr:MULTISPECIES: hypothetical protein [Paenibacillus]